MECFSDLGLHSDVFVAILATLQDSTTSTVELEELNEEAAHVLCVNSANMFL